ncbi:MAG: hypothetical protein J0I98_02460 [Mesorhizobium sp.]|nr:hypothetical protein [Mesorhizobium sp.]MBN9241636.1 hypothetical protein [Mesorhizobium sp.]
MNKWTSAGLAGGDFLLAPMVIWLRLPAMLGEASHPDHWPRESFRAVTEKAAAAAEGLAAAQISMAMSMAGFWPEFLSGRVPSIWNGVAFQRSLGAALRPASRRVRANYRRLSAKSSA